jgi:hypothetical protein
VAPRLNSVVRDKEKTMIKVFSCFVSIFILIFNAVVLFAAEEKPTVLQCVSNSIAHRDYHFSQHKWVGEKDKPTNEFRTGTLANPNNLILRDKIFSRLDTNKPIMKSITPKTKYVNEEQVAEFEGLVLDRTDTLITIIWKNPYDNKFWFAAIDLKYKKAVVSHVYEGITSFGVDVETLDCK